MTSILICFWQIDSADDAHYILSYIKYKLWKKIYTMIIRTSHDMNAEHYGVTY